MNTKVSKVHLDIDATNENILSIAKSKGMSLKQFNSSVHELSARYRDVSGQSRLSEIDRYVVISQVLEASLNDMFMVC